jgi:hypothetical protein
VIKSAPRATVVDASIKSKREQLRPVTPAYSYRENASLSSAMDRMRALSIGHDSFRLIRLRTLHGDVLLSDYLCSFRTFDSVVDRIYIHRIFWIEPLLKTTVYRCILNPLRRYRAKVWWRLLVWREENQLKAMFNGLEGV